MGWKKKSLTEHRYSVKGRHKGTLYMNNDRWVWYNPANNEHSDLSTTDLLKAKASCKAIVAFT